MGIADLIDWKHRLTCRLYGVGAERTARELPLRAKLLGQLLAASVAALAVQAAALEELQRGAIVAERTRFAREIHDTLAQGAPGEHPREARRRRPHRGRGDRHQARHRPHLVQATSARCNPGGPPAY